MISREYMENPENFEHEVFDRLYLLDESDFDRSKVDDGYIDAALKARDILLEHYKQQKYRIEYLEELISIMETYYSITVEDLENCVKNDK